MKTLRAGGNFFEGPRWHQGAWWVSDLYAGQVLRITPTGDTSVVAEIDDQPSGLGWLPDGDLLVVSMKERRLLRVARDGAISVHADLSAHTEFWANDMVVDAQGRAYVGNLGFNPWAGEKLKPASLICVHPDGRVDVVAEDLLFPNGAAVTSDGKTLIVAESLGNRISAFSINSDGSLGERRVWAQFGNAEAFAAVDAHAPVDCAPDGIALDVTGKLWVADARHNRVLRVADGGGIDRIVHGPAGGGTYSCTIGGADGRTLLMCCAPDSDAGKRTAEARAELKVCTVDI